SPPDPATDYRDARAIDMILALMDHLGVERVTVVGHSMGGRIAWTFAAQHPQRVHKLVLVAPDGYASPRFGYGKQVEAPAMLGVMRHVLPRPLLHANLEKAYAQADALNESTVSRYHDLIRAPGARQAMLDRLRQTVLIPPEPALRQIRAPTLLLWGESDAMIPLANAHDFLQAIPGSRLATLPAVGHLPQEEAPGASLRLVLAFLGDD
ncbi:MAG: alpha/beta fold hydrolase, partial [bacterium]